MRRWLYLLPVAIFVLMAAGFYVGLNRDPDVLPSPLIDEPAPQFDLPPLPGNDKGLSTADLKRGVSLVNFFASWCAPCREEHKALSDFAARKRVPVYGIDYKDKPEAVAKWLAELGNPYTQIGADDGQIGIEWGVYGVPETYLVDGNGRIRYKHVGPLTQADIDKQIVPLIGQLQK